MSSLLKTLDTGLARIGKIYQLFGLMDFSSIVIGVRISLIRRAAGAREAKPSILILGSWNIARSASRAQRE
jgi:hypothetical protein